MKCAPHMRRVRFSVIRPADQIVYVDVEIVRKQPQAAYARFLFAQQPCGDGVLTYPGARGELDLVERVLSHQLFDPCGDLDLYVSVKFAVCHA